MNPSVTLLLMRIAGALLLLCFLAAIAYFIYRDVQLASRPDERLERPKGFLRVLSSETDSLKEDQEFELSIVSGMGRGPENLIVIDDEYTSGRHALLLWTEELWLVEDLGSRNGTFLNDSPVESQTVIVSGDILTVGRTKFKVIL